MTALPPQSARARVFDLSRDILHKLMTKLGTIETWDDQMLYLAAQLNIMGLIGGSLKVEEGKVNVTNMLKCRVLMDCVTNVIAGCKEGPALVKGKQEVSFVEAELKKLAVPVEKRKSRKGYHRKQFDKHVPDKWKKPHSEGSLLKSLGNTLLHADADAGYKLRNHELRGGDIKAFSMAVYALIQECDPYFEKIGIALNQEEANEFGKALKEALDQLILEKASYTGEFSPFEERVYAELARRGASTKIDKQIVEAPPAGGSGSDVKA
jgi:hypothetical protein